MLRSVPMIAYAYQNLSERLLTLSWPSHWAICRCLWTTRSLRSLIRKMTIILYCCRYVLEKKHTFFVHLNTAPPVFFWKYGFPSCQMDNVSSCSTAVAFGRSTCWCLEANSEQKKQSCPCLISRKSLSHQKKSSKMRQNVQKKTTHSNDLTHFFEKKIDIVTLY